MCQLCQQILNHEPIHGEVLEYGPGDASDSFQNNTNVRHEISVGDVFAGLLSTNDTDVVEVELLAGRQYTVSVTPRGTATDVQDPVVLVVDRNGEEVAFNDDVNWLEGDYSSEVTFMAQYSGTYRLVATTHSTYYDTNTFDFGVYHMEIRQAPANMQTEWTFDQIADYLNFGGWGNQTYRWNLAPGGTLTYNVTGLTNDGKDLARTALDSWSAVTGINFLEVTFGGQIEFDDNQGGAFAQFFTSGSFITSAEVNVSTNWVATYGADLNDYAYQTYIHEIGHALGLAHAGDYDGGARYGRDNLYLNDSWQQSVMSYFDQDDNTFVNATEAYVVSPQIADILAIQDLYGVAGNLRTGNTTYGDNGSGAGYYADVMTLSNVTYTIIDDGGIDTLDTSSHGGNQTVYLEAETYSDIFGEIGNLGIARGTVIENFEGGSGKDLVFGNDANNEINGNNGDDSIYAGNGADLVRGGSGNDRLVGNGGNDDLRGGTGNDILKGKDGNNWLRGDDGDDKLVGSDTGVDNMYGGNNSDILSGLSGADVLDGESGNDFLYGGRDDDVVRGGNGDDVVRGNRNNDELYGENGTDNLYGGGNNDQLFGGADRDFLLGENGNDSLDGGTGDDNLTGGAGVDTFIYRDASYGYDRVLDFENGTDRIDLSDFGFSGMGDINPIAGDVSAGVRLNFGDGNVLLLEGINESQLDAGDFIF